MNTVTKVRIGAVLSFCVVFVDARNHIDLEMIIRVMGMAFLISLPLIFLIWKNKTNLNKLFTKGVVILAVPIGALLWQWLDAYSLFGKITAGFILSSIFIAYSAVATEKELQEELDKKKTSDKGRP